MVLPFLLVSCGEQAPTRRVAVPLFTEWKGEALGTTWFVKLATKLEPDHADRARAGVEAALDAVDRAMSTYRDDSELMAFNRHPAGEPFTFSPETFAVLAAALEVAEASDGAYDIAVGPLVNAWGFGPDGVGTAPDAAAPDAETITALMERTDARRQLTLDAVNTSVTKARDDVFIDLSGIAKGHAVDRMTAALAAEGITDALVEVGGEMRGVGRRHDGAPWRVGVEQPVAVRGVVQRILSLYDKAIATSGDYRNVREHEGERISHIIDPRTGRSIDHAATSVSVVADDCMTADAWATALLVLGSEAGLEVAEAHGLAAFFLVRQDDGTHTEAFSTAFRESMMPPAFVPREPAEEP